MQPNKIYESLAHLANNIIKNEKLRYELFDKPLFKDQFVKQINNMLVLEKDFNQELNDKKWATIFAKAIVKIIDKKQRFEKPDGRSLEEIYADYSSFLSYTITTFMIGRNELVDETIKFTEEDVLYNAKLSEETKELYKNLENEKKFEEQNQEEVKQTQSNNKENNFNQNSQNNYFGGANFGSQNAFMSMPIHPMQDPRFYPYNSKPKWMLSMKWILAIITIIATLMLIITSAVMMNIKLDFNYTSYGDALFKNATDPSGIVWDGSNWDAFVDPKVIEKFPLQYSLMIANFQTILGFFFYVFPAIWIGYYAFKKPKSMTEKYRLNFWSVLFMIVFFAFSIFSIFNFISSNRIKTIFVNTFKTFLKSPEKINDNFSYDFDGFWTQVMNKNNYGNEIRSTTIVVDIAIAFISLAMLLGIILLIINPKIDREKVMLANTEFEKATIAAMQGQDYKMNSSLYETEDEVNFSNKPSKFSIWLSKGFKKNKKEDKEK